MRRYPKKLITILLGVSLLMASCSSLSLPGVGDGCEPNHENLSTVTEGKLTVAALSYPPFSGFDADGNLNGAEGEIIARIAEMECLELEVLKDDAKQIYPAVISGRADTLVGGWYRLEFREELVLQGAPVLQDRIFFVAKEAINTVEGLKGKRVGSVEGFSWNEGLEKVLGEDLVLYNGTAEMYPQLRIGAIDVVVDTFPTAQAALASDPIDGVVFTYPEPSDLIAATKQPAQTNFPVNNENRDLLLAINDGIADLRASGEIAEIAERNGFKPEAAKPGPPNLL